MGSLMVSQRVTDIGPCSHHYMMVGGGLHQNAASDKSSKSGAGRKMSMEQAESAPATPTSPTIKPNKAMDTSERPSSSSETPATSSQPAIQEPDSENPSSKTIQPTHNPQTSKNLNQHSRGFDQSGFPLTNDPRVLTSSPSSPRLQPTYRSTRSLGGSEATSPSRIKIRDLSHIKSFASEEVLTRPRPGHRPGSIFYDSGRQYEISSMPVSDIIEMVAGLLTKLTTTNDRQHEHVHRPIPPPEETANMSPQTSCVLAFHGKNVPSITILSYLSRIHKYCPTTYEVFLSLLVYFDRMTEMVNRGFLQHMRRQAGQASAQETVNPEPLSPTPMSIDSPEASTPQTSVATPPSSGTIAPKDSRKPSSIPPSPSLPPGQGDLSQFFVVDSYNIHRLVIAGVTCASKFFSDVFYTNSRYAKVGGLPLVELNHLELQFLLLNDFRLSVSVEDLEAYGTMLVEFYAREVMAEQQQHNAQQQSSQRGIGSPVTDVMYMRESSRRNTQTATPP